jgi:hypothetical protein
MSPKPENMIWVITIATFLGTLVAVVLLFFIFSRREHIREALHLERRMESRVPDRVGMELYSPDGPSIIEITLTENLSRHGARVFAKRPWQANDSVIVKLLRGGKRTPARIAYCKRLKGDSFAVGLQFPLQ